MVMVVFFAKTVVFGAKMVVLESKMCPFSTEMGRFGVQKEFILNGNDDRSHENNRFRGLCVVRILKGSDNKFEESRPVNFRRVGD